MSVRITPVAKAVPFDNSTNGYTSTEVQGAIEEGVSIAIGTARYSVFCAYESNANSGRWLEFTRGNSSDDSPYIVVGPTTLEELTLITANTSDTCTVTLFKNGVSATTISLAAEKTKVTFPALSLANLDQISLQVTSGSITKPQVQLFLRKND